MSTEAVALGFSVKKLFKFRKIHRKTLAPESLFNKIEGLSEHKYSLREINTYCVNKPCTILFYFFFTPSTAMINHCQSLKGK